MAIEYLGLSEINGPLVVLEGVQNAAFDEIVEMTVNGSWGVPLTVSGSPLTDWATSYPM